MCLILPDEKLSHFGQELVFEIQTTTSIHHYRLNKRWCWGCNHNSAHGESSLPVEASKDVSECEDEVDLSEFVESDAVLTLLELLLPEPLEQLVSSPDPLGVECDVRHTLVAQILLQPTSMQTGE